MKNSYLVYGLVIHSHLSFPELLKIEGEADVVVCLKQITFSPIEVLKENSDFKVTDEGVILFWKDEATILVRNGHEIIVDPAPGVDERVLRLLVLGPALAVVLHQRKMLALHAAAVELNGGAIVFVGGPGSGKSTLAAVFHKRGYGIITDDVTAIHPDKENNPLVFPGFPQLKLWPEAVTSLGYNPDELPLLEPGSEKRVSPITQRFSQNPVPLQRIYVLAEAQTKEIISLKPQDALIELVRYSYRASLLKWIGAERHFSHCASLVNSVPIKRLNRPLSFSALPNVARMVEKDLFHG